MQIMLTPARKHGSIRPCADRKRPQIVRALNDTMRDGEQEAIYRFTGLPAALNDVIDGE